MRIASADGTQAPVVEAPHAVGSEEQQLLLTVARHRDGREISGDARLAGRLVIFIGCFLTLGASKQALHDRICDTAVWRRTWSKPAMAA